MTAIAASKIDFTQVQKIENHRYRFWFTFPNDAVIRNQFAVPGYVPPEDAAKLAQAAWAESLRSIVGTRPPPEMKIGKFSNTMARSAAEGAHWTVARPGSEEYKG
jgi:hypothetical protein